MSRNIEAAGVSVYLQEHGTGPSILFLHGNPDSSDLWIPVIERLQDSFRCFAPDLPGFGQSVAPRDFDCSLSGMAQFIDALVERAQIPLPLHLVVHDFGGPYGLAWAVTQPQKIASLCVINTTFFSDFRWHFWARVWRTPLLGELSMTIMNRPMFAQALKRGSSHLSSEQIDQVYRKVTPSMKRMVLKLYRTTEPENFRGWEDRLLALTSNVPALVLWGQQDPYISRKYADRFGARKVIRYDNSGHWPPAEIPDRVAQDIKQFINSEL